MHTGNEVIPIPTIADNAEFRVVLMDALHLHRDPWSGKDSNAYSCGGDCSCVFIPDWEGDIVFLDRFIQSRSDCYHGVSNCFCHSYPHIIDNTFASVIWSDGSDDYDEPKRCKCGKPATAFVFAQFSENGVGGPRWVCEDVCPKTEPVINMVAVTRSGEVVETAKENEAARKSVEFVLLAAGIPEGH